MKPKLEAWVRTWLILSAVWISSNDKHSVLFGGLYLATALGTQILCSSYREPVK